MWFFFQRKKFIKEQLEIKNAVKMGQHESQDFSIVTKECHFYEIIIVHTFRKKKSCFNIWNRALRVLPKVKMVNFFEKGQFSDFWDNFNHFQTLYEERYFAHYVIELQSPLTNGQMNQWTTWHPQLPSSTQSNYSSVM